jgi:hypothetical protein
MLATVSFGCGGGALPSVVCPRFASFGGVVPPAPVCPNSNWNLEGGGGALAPVSLPMLSNSGADMCRLSTGNTPAEAGKVKSNMIFPIKESKGLHYNNGPFRRETNFLHPLVPPMKQIRQPFIQFIASTCQLVAHAPNALHFRLRDWHTHQKNNAV